MKTFTAEELSNNPAQVYREADKNGSVQISHDRYPDVVFVLSAVDIRIDDNDVEVVKGMTPENIERDKWYLFYQFQMPGLNRIYRFCRNIEGVVISAFTNDLELDSKGSDINDFIRTAKKEILTGPRPQHAQPVPQSHH